MSEAAKTSRTIAEARRQERAERRVTIPERLAAAGIAFERKNNGAHLIVRHRKHTIDFWPGTGLWIERGSDRRRYGVRGLVKHLEHAN